MKKSWEEKNFFSHKQDGEIFFRNFQSTRFVRIFTLSIPSTLFILFKAI